METRKFQLIFPGFPNFFPNCAKIQTDSRAAWGNPGF
jgi:hypothetical protein